MPSVLQNGLALLRAPAIEVGFALRSVLRWSRGAPVLTDTADGETFGWAEPEHRAALEQRLDVLREQFTLDHFAATQAPDVRSRNFARLEQLEQLSDGLTIPTGPDGVVRAADFGCGDFHYAAALQQWLARHQGAAEPTEPRRVVLRGLELDGHGIYRDGHSRADHARARASAAAVEGSLVQFEVADAAHSRLPEQDVVSLFFPFLTAYACLSWGAPLSRLRPGKLLERAVQSVRPGGWLLVANQTEGENRRLNRMMEGLPVVRIARCLFATDMVPDAARTQDQVGSLWQRQVTVPPGMHSG